MRFKLILLTSLIAAIVAALVSTGLLTISGLGSIDYAPDSPAYKLFHWIQLVLLLPPFLTAILAGIFVYRHTAIRRKLQGSVTAVLVVAYCLAAFVLLKLTVN